MELTQLKYFVTAVDQESIRKASVIHDVSPAAISKAVKKLEDEFGTELLKRKGNYIDTSDAGCIAYDYAKVVTQKADILERNILEYNQQKKTFAVGACDKMPLKVTEWLCKDISFKGEVSTDEIKLIHDFYDWDYSVIILNHKLNGRKVISRKFYDEQLFIAVKPENELAKRSEVYFSDIKDKFIILEDCMEGWRSVLENYLPHSVLDFVPSEEYEYLRLNNSITQIRTNKTIDKYKDREKLVYIPLMDSDATRTFYMHYWKWDKLAEKIAIKSFILPWNEILK